MTVESGQRREAGGTFSCQLRVPSFSVTHPCVVQARFWSHICVLALSKGVGACEVVVRVSLGVFCYTSSRCAQGISVHAHQCTVKHIFSVFARMSRFMRECGHDSAKDNEGDATEGRDKSQGYGGTEDVDGDAHLHPSDN